MLIFQGLAEDFEDEVSIDLHIRDMQTEMKKRSRKIEVIEEPMLCTYMHWRKEVREGTLTIQNLLDKYPALKLQKCVSRSFFVIIVFKDAC